MFVAGTCLFTAASLAGGVATGPEWLLASRAWQGAGAARAGPGSLALVATTFEEGEARGRALGVLAVCPARAWSSAWSWASWRWVLLVNVPAGAAIALLAPRWIREGPGGRGRFDLAGAFSATAGTTRGRWPPPRRSRCSPSSSRARGSRSCRCGCWPTAAARAPTRCGRC
ncbi:hypothetical protein [Spirillospora sp. CA-294931]|uniref:hypothetical protein n=1 Tax=Spirillospora sp. CA-294931 TaxID=3240042 RepID=UPI003D8A9916